MAQTQEMVKGDFSHGACNSGADVGFLVIIQLCQSKIRYLGAEVFIQQNITSLDISVYYPWL